MKKQAAPYRPKGNVLQKIFAYLEPLWIGNDGKISLRLTLSISFAINIMFNTNRALKAIFAGASVADVALILGIQAGLIAGLLALKTYQNTVETRVEAETDPPPEYKGD